ncbi:8332_t:CDS:1, partial [Racocetra persica]
HVEAEQKFKSIQEAYEYLTVNHKEPKARKQKTTTPKKKTSKKKDASKPKKTTNNKKSK